MTSNGKSHNIVKEYLESIDGITSIQYSKYQDFISVIAPVSVWENLFETIFFTVSRKGGKEEKIDGVKNVMAVRTLQYKLPKLLRGHVSTVLNTVQAPIFKKSKRSLDTGNVVNPVMLSIINENMKNIVNKTDNSGDVMIKKDKKSIDCEGKKEKKMNKYPSKNVGRMGLSYPRLLNEVYNIQNNNGKYYHNFFVFLMTRLIRCIFFYFFINSLTSYN